MKISSFLTTKFSGELQIGGEVDNYSPAQPSPASTYMSTHDPTAHFSRTEKGSRSRTSIFRLKILGVLGSSGDIKDESKDSTDFYRPHCHTAGAFSAP